ncbi:MAG: DUF2238 domain-containing protein [archaeon]
MDRPFRSILVFTVAYFAFFTALAFVRGNFEFLYYITILLALLVFIVFYQKKLHLSIHILAGLSLVGCLHFAGGNLYFGGQRLYEIYFLPFLRFDNIVHFFGTITATFVCYNMLRSHLDNIRYDKYILCLILVIMAMGLGALNEVLEFGAVVFLGAAQQVGDYFNNALDLLFNLTGSVIACFFIHPYHKKQLKS